MAGGTTKKVIEERIGRGYRMGYCTCEHPYQDKKYGKGNRVFNTGSKRDTCTVCGRTKEKT